MTSRRFTPWRASTPAGRPAVRTVLRPARVALRAVQRSPVAFLAERPLVRRARARASSVRARDVLGVLDALQQAGIPGWVAGGWGVDALLGRQTRQHADLDVVVPGQDGTEQQARRALAALGFRKLRTESFTDGRPMPVRWLLDDGIVLVELLPVDPERPPFTGLLDPCPSGAAAGMAGRDLPDHGVIAGRRVRCLPLQLQLRLHQGYPQRARDRKDMALLGRLPGARPDQEVTR